MEIYLNFGKSLCVNKNLLNLLDVKGSLNCEFGSFEKVYKSLLDVKLCDLVNHDNFKEVLKFIKRDEMNCGPYPRVSIYENSNRILSDLIVIEGSKWLIKKYNMDLVKMEINLGNSHKYPYDIVGYDKNDSLIFISECFNIARNNANIKINYTSKKLGSSEKLECAKYVFHNSDLTINIKREGMYFIGLNF